MTEHKNIQNTQANLDLQGESWVDRGGLIQTGLFALQHLLVV